MSIRRYSTLYRSVPQHLVFKARRTNVSGSHWHTEKQGLWTGNSCFLHLPYKKPSKIKRLKINLIELIRNKEDKAVL